jgi:hypothetical protein
MRDAVPLSGTLARVIAVLCMRQSPSPAHRQRAVGPTSSPICQRYCAAAGATAISSCRGDLFHLIDRYLRTNIGNIRSAPALACGV